MWVPTMQTLALMVVAVLVSVVVGALLGLGAGLSDRLDRILRPVLDTMQVLPAFAYLLPVVLVFGIGVPAAVLATVVYAAPPMARLTSLGLRGADKEVLEAVESLGATAPQRLLTARIPLARKELLLGLNQTIMMALSMAVIASVIGAGGLGDRVYQALASVDVGAALAAGIPIVLLAVVLDRITGAAGGGTGEPRRAAINRGGVQRLAVRRWPGDTWAYALLTAVVVAVAGRLAGRLDWPEAWIVNIAEPVNRAVDWMTAHLYSGVPVVGGTAEWAGHFTTWVLDPVRSGLQWLPWWSVLLLVAALAWLIGTWRTALTAVLAMAAIGVLGVWQPSLDTLSQVLAAVAVTLVLGFATGIAAARSDRFERLLRPVLDVFQTMPQFVYLIPVVALFGVGRAPPRRQPSSTRFRPSSASPHRACARSTRPPWSRPARSARPPPSSCARSNSRSPGRRCSSPSTRAWSSSSPSSSSAAWSAEAPSAMTPSSAWHRATWRPAWSRAPRSSASD